MPLKATTLYAKIAEQMKLVSKDDLDRATMLQDAHMVDSKFVPIGDILLQDQVITPESNRAILVQHKFNNCRQDDKILGDWVTHKGYATEYQVEKCLEETKDALARGQKKLPRLSYLLINHQMVEGETKVLVLRINKEVLDPLHEMTRYFTHLVDEANTELTLGRIAFQNSFVAREDLFEFLLDRVLGGATRWDILETIRARDRLSLAGEESARDMATRFPRGKG
ncbi:MAG: hypothetical protein HY720_27435 [Planctomycetes bacterium]|nr:hypothetical protein [Planctomycetota bacterium]